MFARIQLELRGLFMKMICVLSGLLLLTACGVQTQNTGYAMPSRTSNQYVPMILSDETGNGMAPVVSVCGQGAYTAYLNNVYRCVYAPVILP